MEPGLSIGVSVGGSVGGRGDLFSSSVSSSIVFVYEHRTGCNGLVNLGYDEIFYSFDLEGYSEWS